MNLQVPKMLRILFFKKNLLDGVIGNTVQWGNRISSEDQNLDLRSWDH
jgi:hypothetical protein